MRHIPALAIVSGLIMASTAPAYSAQSAPTVTEAPLRAHLAFLADDLLEGRGTGQRGGALTVRYLETQAAAIGLKPANGASYRQSVAMVGTKTLPTSTLRFEVNGKIITPALGQDIVYGTGRADTSTRVDAPLVFVGYGINAPDETWDDYKGIDMKGKLLIMMVNDPKPTQAEPKRFGGKSLTYNGRWTYKFEEAVRRGAAGVLLIHTTESASYPFSVPANGFAHEQFHLAGPGNPLQGWITEDAARGLFKAAGKDLDALRTEAETRTFQPVALGATAHAALNSAIRKVEDFNVAGIVPGTDPALRAEAVIYSAHWDHLGMAEGEDGKADHIWNGAVDNASGTAALLAMAEAAVRKPTRRTQIFLWPCAEEQGLIGSAAYVAAPLWPLAKTAADLNLDSMNFVGATRDSGRRRRTQHPAGKFRQGGQLDGPASGQADARHGRQLLPRRPFQLCQSWRAGVQDWPSGLCGRRHLRIFARPGQVDARRAGLQGALPPGDGPVRPGVGPVWHGAAGPVHLEPGL